MCLRSKWDSEGGVDFAKKMYDQEILEASAMATFLRGVPRGSICRCLSLIARRVIMFSTLSISLSVCVCVCCVCASFCLLPKYLQNRLTYCHQFHMRTSLYEYLKLIKFWGKFDKNWLNDDKWMIKDWWMNDLQWPYRSTCLHASCGYLKELRGGLAQAMGSWFPASWQVVRPLSDRI